MALLLTFALVLFAGVLLSSLAHRTIVSTAVLFLLAGFALGEGSLSVLPLRADDPIVRQLAELALFSVLYTDAMRVGAGDLRRAWRLPGRALILGMPLTFALTAVLARYVGGLPWVESMLVGAVLAPTDPVFASAIVGRKEIPGRLRHLLNVESGLNDGLALPVVVLLLAVLGNDEVEYARLGLELAGGVAIGVVVPLVAGLFLRSRYTGTTSLYEPLGGLAIGLTVLATASLLHANLFLAAFAAGVTVATFSPDVERAFAAFGELVTELLKLAAILVFGALISPAFLAEISLPGYAFGVLALVVARPVAIGLSLLGSRLPVHEQAVVAWFGPKGFASVVYGLLVLDGGGAQADRMFHLIALVIFVSILAHSSTDVPIANFFDRRLEPDEVPSRGARPVPDEARAAGGSSGSAR